MKTPRSGTGTRSVLKILVTASILVAASLAIWRSYGIFRADRLARAGETIDNYSRALSFDPSNASLWWSRGRLRHHSVGEVDLEAAAADYRRALRMNPRLSQAWVDLADCYERTGRIGEAEEALQRALAAHPYSPSIHWQVGNFYLRRGDRGNMYRFFKTATEFESDKLAIAIDIAWKVDPDHEGILDKLVPNNLRSNLLYLSFLVRRDELDLASPVWSRCLNNPIPRDFEFKPSLVFPYIDRLLARTRVAEAWQVWNDALRKAGLRPGEDRQNLVWNGSFEDKVLGGGFDWRYRDAPGYSFRIDPVNRMDRFKSLRITFEDADIHRMLLSQVIPVPVPGDYILTFFLRTRGLTTDRLPYFVVQGHPDPSAAVATPTVLPADSGWSRITIPFTTSPGCRAVLIALRRDRSSKFDNKIKGTLWLDGFVLSPADIMAQSELP
ncbi:MAG: tetratricopeptide repeat protein [Acidobacteria bacterium]|nr:tetratricopeptide repeat protein [Acidobacteriota bacterium]